MEKLFKSEHSSNNSEWFTEQDTAENYQEFGKKVIFIYVYIYVCDI